MLEKSVALLGVLCVAFGIAFGVDAWSGRGGLLIQVVLVGLLLMLSTEKEFERYIGVVLKRDDEKLGMPHWQHSQVMLLWYCRMWKKRDSYSCMGRDIERHTRYMSPHPGPSVQLYSTHRRDTFGALRC